MTTYASESDDMDHHQKSAQEYLHNYGIAYCLSKAERYREEAGIAMGGYFQLGQHGIDALFRNFLFSRISRTC